MACCVPDFEGGEMKKGKKRGTPTPKTATGARKTAPKRTKKPFRLEVGKTYETREGGHKATITHVKPHSEWPFNGVWLGQGPDPIPSSCTIPFWNERGQIYGSEPEPTDLVREVRQPKAPVARPRAKGSPLLLKRGKKYPQELGKKGKPRV
jgi:hypothetical protein